MEDYIQVYQDWWNHGSLTNVKYQKCSVPLSRIQLDSAIDTGVFPTVPSEPCSLFPTLTGRAEQERASVTRVEAAAEGWDASNLSGSPAEGCVPGIAISPQSTGRCGFKEPGLTSTCCIRVYVALSQLVGPTSVLSFSRRTPRSTPVKLSSAAMVSILVNWFSRMAEPTALSDS